MAWVKRLELTNFRCHKKTVLQARKSGLIILEGKNGSGKTSVLEAIFFALRGRSFRTRCPVDLIHYGSSEARILLTLQSDRQHFIGASVEKRKKVQHLDGSPVNKISEIASRFPVAYLGSKSYELVESSPGIRRRFLDWGVFHVKPQYLSLWRLWRRAHRHRNVYLRSGRINDEVEAWSIEVSKYGEQVSRAREEYVKLLNDELSKLSDWQNLFRGAKLVFRRGWSDEQTLYEAIKRNRAREVKSQRSVVGPQYDDWSLDLMDGKTSGLSQGQQKIACFWLWHVQCRILTAIGNPPLLLVDDLSADLDLNAQQEAVDALTNVVDQSWFTTLGAGYLIKVPDTETFHVEQKLPVENQEKK